MRFIVHVKFKSDRADEFWAVTPPTSLEVARNDVERADRQMQRLINHTFRLGVRDQQMQETQQTITDIESYTIIEISRNV